MSADAASDGDRAGAPTELVYGPEPSWLPLLTAAGLALIVLGSFSGWIWSVAGALLFLPCALSWARSTGSDIAGMPRRQEPASAVLPPVPPRGGGHEG